MVSTVAAIGCRAHSGWAVVVAVTGSPDGVQVIDRRTIVIADPKLSGSKQPYHAAERLDFDQAERLIHRCAESTGFLARKAVQSIVEDVRKQGYDIAGCGIVLASGRPATTLAATLASHALIHTAEGEFFREALAGAGRECGLPLTRVKERELYDRGVKELNLSMEELQFRVQEMGRKLGPPWRQDEKLAALVGWLALIGKGGK
jgi:hypothetical protein